MATSGLAMISEALRAASKRTLLRISYSRQSDPDLAELVVSASAVSRSSSASVSSGAGGGPGAGADIMGELWKECASWLCQLEVG